MNLKWEHVDQALGFLRLPDSKTGARIVTLGAPALQLLAGVPQFEGNPYVFPGERRGHHLVGLPKVWRKARDRADLPSLRLHDLRHAYGSVAATSGAGLFIVAKLLGHADLKSTQRYVHLADDPVRAMADQTAKAIDAHMAGNRDRRVIALSQPR